MSKVELTTCAPVPEDRSHTKIRADGQQEGYIVLTPEERRKGFVQPVRQEYKHLTCGAVTYMGLSLSETYACDPWFYSGTFCYTCGTHFPLDQFVWKDTDESLDPCKWSEKKFQEVVEAKKALKERAP